MAAIGIFDGVHRGHQAILRKAAARARAIGGTPAAVTFYPHPLTVLHPRLVPPLLLSLDQRLEGFQACGIRAALVIPFNRSFSRWSPDQFVRQLLAQKLRVREVVVGHDFGFGTGRSGSTETLKALGRQFGFRVHIVLPVKAGPERIASHRIRRAIRAGQLEKAARLLGKPVTVAGRVIRGARRGRGLGFPTANLRVEAGVLPPVGVYAVRVKMSSSPSVPPFGGTAEGRLPRGSDSRWSLPSTPIEGLPSSIIEGGNDLLLGMANLGFRPTFRPPFSRVSPVSPVSPLLEIHLFGVNRPLYRRRLEVAFLRRLRPERRFPSPEALRLQLQRDALLARSLL